MASDPTVQEVLAEAFKAHSPLMNELSLDTKIMLYLAIQRLGTGATNEILDLGVSLLADRDVQAWMQSRLLTN